MTKGYPFSLPAWALGLVFVALCAGWISLVLMALGRLDELVGGIILMAVGFGVFLPVGLHGIRKVRQRDTPG